MGPPGPPGPKVSTYISVILPHLIVGYFFVIMVCLDDNDTNVADVLLFIVIFFSPLG